MMRSISWSAAFAPSSVPPSSFHSASSTFSISCTRIAMSSPELSSSEVSDTNAETSEASETASLNEESGPIEPLASPGPFEVLSLVFDGVFSTTLGIETPSRPSRTDGRIGILHAGSPGCGPL